MYFAIVNPAIFNGNKAKEDTNGRMPVILNPVYGKMPFNRIINGSIADNLGLTPGKNYLIQGVFIGDTNPATGEVRQQLQVTNLGEVSAVDMILNKTKFLNEMGTGKVEGKEESSSKTAPRVEAEAEVPETADDDKPF